MNGRKIFSAGARLALLGIAAALSACATAPSAHQELSILDAVDRQRSQAPVSCAAMGISAVCEKSTRLGAARNCGCADAHALADGAPQRF
jgi:hypothetical protein